jgi:hypothetical protein
MSLASRHTSHLYTLKFIRCMSEGDTSRRLSFSQLARRLSRPQHLAIPNPLRSNHHHPIFITILSPSSSSSLLFHPLKHATQQRSHARRTTSRTEPAPATERRTLQRTSVLSLASRHFELRLTTHAPHLCRAPPARILCPALTSHST